MSAAAQVAGERDRTFKHGVHPPEHKEISERCGIQRMPFVPEYVLPLSQHIGAPSKPVVDVGERVRRGQLIAKPGGFVSVGLHAPVTGRVKAIELRLHPNGKMAPAIVIETDPYASQVVAAAEPVDAFALDARDFIGRVQQGGIVGLGGAAFPAHVKYSVPEGKKVRWVVINGCECEPYLTCDHRVMLERPGDVVRGTEMIMRQVGAERGYIGVENNKRDAIALLRAAAPDAIDVVALKVKYPQGAEKMLIDSIFKRHVPAGGLPLDLEMLVNNCGTAATLVDLFDHGIPLIERVVTITGHAVKHPKNLVVPLGTPLSAVLAECGGLLPSVRQVILGGPMMGMAQKDLDVPVLKGVSGILCLDHVPLEGLREYACIRCGRCVDACPMFLNPARLAQLARAERPAALKEQQLLNCFECASCSFVCPSSIPLVQWMRMGKAMIRNMKES